MSPDGRTLLYTESVSAARVMVRKQEDSLMGATRVVRGTGASIAARPVHGVPTRGD